MEFSVKDQVSSAENARCGCGQEVETPKYLDYPAEIHIGDCRNWQGEECARLDTMLHAGNPRKDASAGKMAACIWLLELFFLATTC